MFEPVKCYLVLHLISFMDENACSHLSHLHDAPKRYIELLADVLSSGNLSQGNDRQNWIMSEALVVEESSSNFIFNE